MHLDPYYLVGSSFESACHDNAGSHSGAGRLGSPESGCDSPIELINSAFNFLKTDVVVDFVIWTGDNSRHDSVDIPKTFDEIISTNANLTRKMENAFRRIPIIPSFGNNDLLPHNILPYHARGDERHLNAFGKLWEKHIPDNQMKTFNEIGCFYNDIGPAIRVLSINTLFLYRQNTAVSDCTTLMEAPGDIVLGWLESKLFDAKMKRMRVYLTGHIPPGIADY